MTNAWGMINALTASVQAAYACIAELEREREQLLNERLRLKAGSADAWKAVQSANELRDSAVNDRDALREQVLTLEGHTKWIDATASKHAALWREWAKRLVGRRELDNEGLRRAIEDEDPLRKRIAHLELLLANTHEDHQARVARKVSELLAAEAERDALRAQLSTALYETAMYECRSKILTGWARLSVNSESTIFYRLKRGVALREQVAKGSYNDGYDDGYQAAEASAAELRKELDLERDAHNSAAGSSRKLREELHRLNSGIRERDRRTDARIAELEAERTGLRAQLSRPADWSVTFGAALKPKVADTYGEGVRDCKDQVASLLTMGIAHDRRHTVAITEEEYAKVTAEARDLRDAFDRATRGVEGSGVLYRSGGTRDHDYQAPPGEVRKPPFTWTPEDKAKLAPGCTVDVHYYNRSDVMRLTVVEYRKIDDVQVLAEGTLITNCYPPLVICDPLSIQPPVDMEATKARPYRVIINGAEWALYSGRLSYRDIVTKASMTGFPSMTAKVPGKEGRSVSSGSLVDIEDGLVINVCHTGGA